MTDNGFVIRGYTPHQPGPCEDIDISRVFEKEFRDDDENLKYVILVNKWLPISNLETGELVGPAYEFDIILVPKSVKKSIRVSFNYEWTVDEVEAEAQRLYMTGLFDIIDEPDDEELLVSEI